MKTLILETSTEKSCICLKTGDKADTVFLTGGPELSKRIALEVAFLIKTHSILPDAIMVGEGPGSFTGVRVGMALAKALAFGWKIPLFGFCSMQIFPPRSVGKFAILVDARMGGIHVLEGEIGHGNQIIFEKGPDLLPIGALTKRLEDTPLLVSPHPQIIQKRLDRLCLEADPCFENSLDLKPLGELSYGGIS